MVIEVLMVLLMLAFCIYASISDIRHGIISNGFILIFMSSAALFDCIYYILVAPELFISFGINVAIIIAFTAAMYASHSWAGGDCKLLVAIGLAYPAGCYLPFMGNTYTLYLGVCLAFIAGFFYLLADSVVIMIKGKAKISLHAIKAGVVLFVKNYLIVMLYIVAISLMYSCFLAKYLQINGILLTAVYMCLALCISSTNIFRHRMLLVAVFIFGVAISFIYSIVPIGTNAVNYLFILFAVIIHLIVANQNYRELPTGDVEKGMILATVSTLSFPQSKVKGLPNISNEDLRSRLSGSEAKSVRNWENSRYGSHTVFIVRKIPFAIFIAIGVLGYLLLWGMFK